MQMTTQIDKTWLNHTKNTGSHRQLLLYNTCCQAFKHLMSMFIL